MTDIRKDNPPAPTLPAPAAAAEEEFGLSSTQILGRTPTELQHNQALQESILFQEQLDKLIASSTKRFNDTLELLEHYREGLGQRLRQIAEEALQG